MVVMARVPVGERRALLVAAAYRVLLRDGLGAATTRAICAEADMPQGTFHYCFGSRDELLAEVAGSLVPAEMSAATAAIDRTGTLTDVVHRALLGYWDLAEADPDTQRVIYEITAAGLRDPALADGIAQRYRGYPELVGAVLEEIAVVRRVAWQRPVPVLARQIVALLDGLTLQFLADGDRVAAREALAACASDVAAQGRRARQAVSV